MLIDMGDRYRMAGPLPALAIPTTLHDSLTARLDRLAPVREVAQIAACIGRDFDYDLLAAASGMPEEALRHAELVIARALAAADAEAADVAEPVVLLSPACASFDQYRNFEVRGDKFRELVRALPGLTPSV